MIAGERGPEGKPGPPGPPGPISVKYTSDEGEMFDPGLSSPPGKSTLCFVDEGCPRKGIRTLGY